MAHMKLYNEALEKIQELLRTKGETTNFQLEKIARQLFKSRFAGVFAADDNIKLSRAKPYAIVNAGRRSGGGFHWYPVCLTKTDTILASDSFGRPIRTFSEDYRKLTRDGRLKVISTSGPEQRNSENNCGARSLAWLWICDRMGPQTASKI